MQQHIKKRSFIMTKQALYQGYKLGTLCQALRSSTGEAKLQPIRNCKLAFSAALYKQTWICLTAPFHVYEEKNGDRNLCASYKVFLKCIFANTQSLSATTSFSIVFGLARAARSLEHERQPFVYSLGAVAEACWLGIPLWSFLFSLIACPYLQVILACLDSIEGCAAILTGSRFPLGDVLDSSQKAASYLHCRCSCWHVPLLLKI